MARIRELFPPYHDSTGSPNTGTAISKSFLDKILTALEGALYSETLPTEITPVSVQEEVVVARGGATSLDARLDAIDALLAGTATPEAASGGVGQNLVINDSFLIWAAGVTYAPSGWTGTSVTYERLTTGGGKVGHAYCQLTFSGAGTFYTEILSAAEVSTLASMGFLTGRDFAAGLYLRSATPGVVSVFIDDGGASYVDEANMPELSESGWAWKHYGGALGATPSRLRIGITVTEACVVDVASASGVFAVDAPAYVPAPTRKGVFVFGAGTEGEIVVTGDPRIKARFRPPTYIWIEDVCMNAISVGPSTGDVTAKLWKGGTNIFVAADTLKLSSGLVNGVRFQPATAALASIGPDNFLMFEMTACPAEVRGISCEVRYVEYLSPVYGLTGGGAVL